MNADFFHDIPGGERKAEALDRALDDFVRGKVRRVNRLDRELGGTVERLFALADVAGMGGSGAPVTPRRKLIPWPMRQVVSVASTVAAVIILAIGLNTTVPHFRNQTAGLGTAVPTSDAEEPRQYVALSPDDCDVQPRDRQEVIDILSVDPGSDWYGESRGPAEIDETTYMELDTVLRQWQACRYYGQTFEWLNLVSSNWMRDEVYGNRFPRPVYAEATLEDIVDGWVETDAARATGADRAVSGTFLIVRDTSAEPMMTGSTRIDVSVDIVEIGTGDIVDAGYVVFVYELGAWRISITGIDPEVMYLVDPEVCDPCYEEYSQ